MHSLGIVQWNSTRRDHPGNPGGVSGSGLVRRSQSSAFKLNGGIEKLKNFLEAPEKHSSTCTSSLAFSGISSSSLNS